MISQSVKEMKVNHFEKNMIKPELEEFLSNNLSKIQNCIARVLEQCSDPDRKVILVAVSKKQPLEKISALARLGQTHFGENYVQEAFSKMETLGDLNIRWHFIGGLQTNKAKYVAGNFVMVHSVDSLKLAQALHKKAQSANIVQPVLIQVNLAGEKQKYGVLEKDLPALARGILELPDLRLDGLMIMPPYFDDPERSKPFFAGLRRLKHDIEQQLGIRMPHLSMGMSGDFEVALKEGATIIRIGELLMGPRTCLLGNRIHQRLNPATG
jgi:pyridoxal phosphate enzyme (YggS family)